MPKKEKTKKKLILNSFNKKKINKKEKIFFINFKDFVNSKKDNFEKNFAKPEFLISKNQLDKDLFYLKKYYKILLMQVSKKMNNYHNLKFNNRSWEIILGPWLFKFIILYIYSYNNLSLLVNKNKLNEIEVYKEKNFNFATQETGGLRQATSNKVWLAMFNSLLIENLELPKRIKKKYLINYQKHIDNYRFQDFYLKARKKLLVESIKNIYRFLPSNKKALISDTYLPKKIELQLNFAMGQMPVIWKPIKLKFFGFKNKKRKKFIIKRKFKDKRLQILSNIIYKFIPTSFIEGFDELNFKVDKLNLPSKPKFIFTSSLYNDDEGFKLYTAKSTSVGTKYFVGQHGNNYFTEKQSALRPELRTCDFFISWGKKMKNEKKILPLFNFKTINKKVNYKNNNKIYIFLRSLHSFQSTFWDEHYEIAQGNNNLIELIEKLPPINRKEIIVRLGNDQKNCKKNFFKKYFSKYESLKEIKFDYYNNTKDQILKNSKLNIHLYDSTGFLEDLSLNFPSVCFLPNKIKTISSSCIKDYKIMIKNNLMFTDINKLRKHLQLLLNQKDFFKWWESNKTQKAIKIFTHNYCIQSNVNAMSKVKKTILEKI